MSDALKSAASVAELMPLRRCHPERSRSSGRAKDLPSRCILGEIPHPAGKNAGLREDSCFHVATSAPVWNFVVNDLDLPFVG
jgi:hypothetical protein